MRNRSSGVFQVLAALIFDAIVFHVLAQTEAYFELSFIEITFNIQSLTLSRSTHQSHVLFGGNRLAQVNRQDHMLAIIRATVSVL